MAEIERPLAHLSRTLEWAPPHVAVAHDVLDEAGCQALVQRIESLGPGAAPITTAQGFVMRPDIRNNDRVVFDDPMLAQQLFQRLAEAFPADWGGGWRAVGMNERFRCYRYRPGHFFAPHLDGAFVRNREERSKVTVLVYLNTCQGGATRLCDYDVAITPTPGRALLFQHAVLHEGCPVTSGTKYVARTDVMYRRLSG